MDKLNQFEWLMRQLEPKEALELRAARDHFMSRKLDQQVDFPLFYLEQRPAANLTISDVLSFGFIWRDTPQGNAYWQAVHDKYKALESQRNRPET